jgi:hypothetical protein
MLDSVFPCATVTPNPMTYNPHRDHDVVTVLEGEAETSSSYSDEVHEGLDHQRVVLDRDVAGTHIRLGAISDAATRKAGSHQQTYHVDLAVASLYRYFWC